jgi:hypothetical protein
MMFLTLSGAQYGYEKGYSTGTEHLPLSQEPGRNSRKKTPLFSGVP